MKTTMPEIKGRIMNNEDYGASSYEENDACSQDRTNDQ